MNNQLEAEAGRYPPPGRQPDPPLTESGHTQARQLAAWAAHDPLFGEVTHLYSSLTTRAVQTAAPLAAALGLDVHGLAAAHECGGLNTGPAGNFSPVVGRDHPSLLQECPTLRWPTHLHGQPWDGGHEPWEQARFARRAQAVTAQLRQASAEAGAGVIALVTHQEFAQYVLADLLNISSLGDTLTLRLDNAATASIEVTPGAAALHWLNRQGHLQPYSV